MGWFRKKRDPASEYARTLNSEISALEEQMKKLAAELEKSQSQPAAPPPSEGLPDPFAQTDAPRPEPVFEPVDRERLEGEPEVGSRDQWNDLGVRKYDLPSLWARIWNHFRRPPPSNPKLVQYLAAGSLQGLRPLRYEKRVARNRLIVTVVLLLLALWGLLYAFKWRR